MSKIVVFGAGGRAGRAVTAEARARGHQVTAVVRDTAKHAALRADGVRLVRGDITDPRDVAAASRDHTAAVHAVSPFSGPEQGFADLDPEFFVKATDALLLGLTEAHVHRLIAIGLFASLTSPSGGLLLDDPDRFPPEIRPFALAHTAGQERLSSANTPIDWLTLTPPALLDPDAPRTGHYHLSPAPTAPDSPAHLSYPDLALALLDEIDHPHHHRTRISVFS